MTTAPNVILIRPSWSLWALALFLLLFAVSGALSQVDGGQDNQDQNQDDSLNNDPNLINPQNKQGYGKDVPDQIMTKTKNKNKKNVSQKTIAEQTHQAILQFGVLVAVSLLVMMLFFLNIGIELLCDKMTDYISNFVGRHKVGDIEDQDPASLVGTFKRYK